MAWDLRYTSAESGPTGRSGFQFVATSPGTPDEVTRAVTPYMAYRPPPDAPSAPAPEELAGFPTALAYGREGDYAVLVRCRYTGRDYSGRYGNFAGHAVVATRHEMEGLRPIELWDSPVWDAPPGEAPELVPGEVFDPEALIGWLAAEDAHDRLAALLDAVTAALADGHGRVVLVAEDVELIARWIALVSFTLPADLAARMSFTTYHADPETAPQILVGTVPSAWPGPGFRLDEPSAPARTGRFAATMAGCWRSGDLDGIDAVGELLTAVNRPAGNGALSTADGAAALLALCRGDESVSADEQSAAAALVRDHGAPSWVWPGLGAVLPVVGFELAAALADVAPNIAERCVVLALAEPALRHRLPPLRLRGGLPEEFRAAVAGAPDLAALTRVVRLACDVGGAIEAGEVAAAAAACARRGAGDVADALREVPGPWRAAMASGVVTGLEAAEPVVRGAMLTPGACAALGDHDWTRSPRTGGMVLSAGADRCEATAGLLDLEPYGLPDIEELLAALWDTAPSPDECRRLVERAGPSLTRFATLRRLPSRVFEEAPLDAEDTMRLAALIRDRLPGLAASARVVLDHGEALRAAAEPEMARVLGRMDPADPVTGRARASVAAALARRPPRSRAAVLAAASGELRAALVAHWLDAGPGRYDRADLAEIEVRLDQAGAPEGRLTDWADGLGWLTRRNVESALGDRDPGLAAAWRALRRRRDT
jgi:GTPase-associated protein 1, N-terminal domain type 2/GTPase-associated protein 1, middle domain